MSPKSLRQKIASSVKADYINNGVLAAGDALPTVRSLQKQYGVSSSTILSAISILEAEGLITSKDRCGCYVTSKSERESKNASRGRQSSKIVGLICPRQATDFLIDMHNGADTICREQDYHVLMATSNSRYDEEQAQVQRLIDAGCEGIVLYPVTRSKKQAESDYLNSCYTNFPIVLVDLSSPEQNRPQVIFDNYQLGRDMTSYLVDKGHRHIAFMDHPTLPFGSKFLCRSIADRYEGYLDVMRAFGRPVRKIDSWELASGISFQDASDAIIEHLQRWQKQDEQPTALIAIQDDYAVLTISIAREMGIAVPDDLEVVGFDDLPVGRLIRPQFATSRPDFKRAGGMAARVIMQSTAGKQNKSTVYVLPVPLVERNAQAYVAELPDLDGLDDTVASAR